MPADKRQLSGIDRLICHFDTAIRTLHGISSAGRPNPRNSVEATENLTHHEQKHAAGLMRINHTGEVCAQALYSGQALTARSEQIALEMQQSAKEEEDHLAWCKERLDELGSKPSLLNPLFYAGSFSMGALAGIIGDRFSLGFIAATEDRVCAHLEEHLTELPENDNRSRAIVSEMIVDEKRHGQKALEAGGATFTEAQLNAMALLSKVMTKTTYHL